jgi:serine/threonine protein kinase
MMTVYGVMLRPDYILQHWCLRALVQEWIVYASFCTTEYVGRAIPKTCTLENWHLLCQGKLINGSVVAVKHLSATSHQGTKQFITEIETISRVQHRNLVKLYGCCLEDNTPLLVYECLENGSLDKALFGTSWINLIQPYIIRV